MTTPNERKDSALLPHEYDEDAVCIHCGFDGAEWSWWKRDTYEGRASDMEKPLCLVNGLPRRR